MGAKNEQQILDFLEVTTLKQSETTKRQFKISKNLIIFSIIIAVVQTLIIVTEFIIPDNKNKETMKLIESQSKHTEVIAQLSLSLLDLQNQVRILERQNEVLSKKIND